MHHLVAPYLGDADYRRQPAWLEQAFTSKSEDRNPANLFKNYESTRLHQGTSPASWRIFTENIFSACGRPGSILDLACGFNPFAIPWMGLPLATEYHAYDIHTPRVKLINQFLRLEKRPPLGEVRDILIDPPNRKCRYGFLFQGSPPHGAAAQGRQPGIVAGSESEAFDCQPASQQPERTA